MTVVLVLVLAVDVVLVALALQPRTAERTADQTGNVLIDVQSPQTGGPPSQPATTSSPSSPPSDPPRAVVMSRLLDASSATQAWRARTGTCPGGGGELEYTQDGGRTWVPVEAGVDAYVRIKAEGGAEAWVVGAGGQGCAAVFVDTEDGETWATSAPSLEIAWYIDPSDRSRLNSPIGAVAGPCAGAIVHLSPVTSLRAAALCPDGGVWVTGTSGATWHELVTVSGAVALTDHGDGFAAAVVGARECAGVSIQALFEGAADVLGCADAPGEPGQVAMSSADGVLWLWAGEIVRVSGDGGRTWG